jgi:hypothetical protein
MIEVEFPSHQFKIKEEGGKEIIFDAFRKQWVVLTPEEWVRQNFLQYLVQVKNYPSTLIAVEREIFLGDVRKRFDIVVYKAEKACMIIECKEMKVPVNESVLKQVLNYNIALQVRYLVVTNGSSTYALHLTAKEHKWLNKIPDFNTLEV